MELGRYFGAAAEHAFDAVVGEVDLLAEGFEELRRGEHALDFIGAEDGERLVDAVLLVELGFADFATFDELDDPARIEIDAEGDAAAVLGKVLDGQAQAARAGGAEHEPVGTFGESGVGEGGGELLVVDAEIVDLHARLGHAGGAAGFKHVDRFIGIALGDPATNGTAASDSF